MVGTDSSCEIIIEKNSLILDVLQGLSAFVFYRVNMAVALSFDFRHEFHHGKTNTGDARIILEGENKRKYLYLILTLHSSQSLGGLDCFFL